MGPMRMARAGGDVRNDGGGTNNAHGCKGRGRSKSRNLMAAWAARGVRGSVMSSFASRH